MPASSKTSGGTTADIVLVEEYDALASAIGSALRKFAPGYNTAVVRSLGEAQAVLRAGVKLLVLDIDPPPVGAVAFFERARSIIADAHVLVIAARIPADVLPARQQPTAFQFVEKPFDLAEFGSLVQSLLAGNAGAGKLYGTLRNLGLPDLIPLHGLSAGTAVLEVEAADGRSGEVHFVRGQMLHAATGGIEGVAALEAMSTWASPRFRAQARRPDARRSIHAPWPMILADALRSVQVPMQPVASVSVVKPVPSPPKARDGKKVVVIDDTEMLRIFVEEILVTADTNLQIATAADAAEGIAVVEKMLPDLVLLDYSLPDSNGDDVCRRLLEGEKTARIPVIMMSGHVPEMIATAARHENVVATLAKPFLSAALVNLVNATLTNPPPFRARVSAPEPVKPAAPSLKVETAALVPKPTNRGNGKKPVRGYPQPASPTAPSMPSVTTAPPPVEPVAAVQSTSTSVALAPAPPLPRPNPAPQPVPVEIASEPSPAPPLAVAPIPSFALPTIAASPSPAEPMAAARIASTRSKGVVVGLPLEVLAMQFSPALQMAAIRARPASPTVSLHISPEAFSGMTLPETGFDIDRVDVDSRGQIQSLRLAPTIHRIPAAEAQAAVPINSIAVLPANGGRAMELMPSPAAPMKLQLLATFELAGVELSPTFGIGRLVLRAAGGKMRVSLQPEAANTGAVFETAQVLLDRSARIAEILLDAVA